MAEACHQRRKNRTGLGPHPTQPRVPNTGALRGVGQEISNLLTTFATSSLYPILHALDETIAREAQELGCSCGGKLHRACYPRKPRGAPPAVDSDKAYC